MIFDTRSRLDAALCALPSLDEGAISAARARQNELTKPPGSLGRLEDIAIFMAGWQGCSQPRLERGRTIIFAGNHGVTAQGISPFPMDVTAQMVANYEAGGAAINALSRVAGLELKAVAIELDRPTADFTQRPAMSEADCLSALSIGAQAVDPDLDLLVLGEMGIGNTTAAAAICALALGGEGRDWAGAGTGLDAEGVARKARVIDRAVQCHQGAPREPLEILRRVGGREIAAMAGAILQARLLRIPVLLDGFIGCSAVVSFLGAAPGITDHCLAGHCSAEPGHARLLDRLGLDPMLRLGLRLGEGSGAALAANLVRAALATHNEMATFAEAGVATAP